jgi:DNA-binding MarR family transcriptional regulator
LLITIIWGTVDGRIIDYVFLLKKKCLIEEGEIGREVGLSPSEIHCIEALENGERVSGNSIAERMGLSPSRGSRIIDHLIGKGLLNRQSDPLDRRISVISLTDRGRKIKSRVERAKGACEAKITEEMAADQIEQIKKNLGVLLDVL